MKVIRFSCQTFFDNWIIKKLTKMKTKILAHSRDPRGNELITYQFELPTYLLPELLKFKKIEVTWNTLSELVDSKEGLMREFTILTLTTSKPALMGFFDKCCPIYSVNEYHKDNSRSLKELNRRTGRDFKDYPNRNKTTNIHLQVIAEEMYDLYNESEAVESESGGWHIPFVNEIDYRMLPVGKSNLERFIEISTALISNPTETDYSKLIETHDQLLKNNDLDTFVHCARVMTDEEYYSYIKGKISLENTVEDESKNYGWCESYKGFISYKNIIENENII